jgi:hypothetical protein
METSSKAKLNAELLIGNPSLLFVYEAFLRANDSFVLAYQQCEEALTSVSGTLKVLPIDFAAYQIHM